MVKPIPPQNVTDTWPEQNIVNPETRSPGLLLGTTLSFTMLTLVIVGLRTYVRFFSLHAPGWDDYFIFVATAGAVGLCITVNLSFNYGWDRHIWDQQDKWFEESELIQYIVQVHFVVIMTCAKLSALCTYLRVAKGTKYRRFVWGTMIFIAIWGISFLFATVFQCTPIHLYWTSRDGGKGCSNEDARVLVAVAINIITDIQVVLMPLPIILKLQIPTKEKITLAILMCLGIFASIASIIRTVVMSQSLSSMRWDMTWNGMLVWIWLIIECDLAIICISVPVLRILVRRFIPRWGGITTSITKSMPGTNTTSAHRPVKQDQSFTSLIQEGRILKTDVIELHGRSPSNGSLPRSRGNDYGYHDYAHPHPPRSKGNESYLRNDISRAV